MGEVSPHLDPQFNYLIGAGSVLVLALLYGACGGILALADVAPEHCIKVYNLFLEKKYDEAFKLQLELIPLNKAIIQTYGIPAIKYSLDLLGFHGGPPRLPLLPLGEEGKKEMEEILNKLGMLEK